MTPVAKERRKFGRAQHKRMLKYRCISHGMHKDARQQIGIMTNVGRGGVEFKTKREYPVGAIFEVTPPDDKLFKGKTVHVKVQWVKFAEEPGHYLIGTAFIRLKK